MKRSSRYGWLCGVTAVLLPSLSAWPAGAQDAAPPSPPPTPSTAAKPVIAPPSFPGIPVVIRREQKVLHEVFGRYPGVDRDHVMEFLREHFPREMKRFRSVVAHDEEAAGLLLAGLVSQAMELLETKDHDPRRFARLLEQRKLERKAESLAELLADERETNRDGIIRALRDVLVQVFEIKQQLMQADVAEMEADLEELKQLVQKREAHRKEIITRRLKDLTGETDYLEW